ncbi:MAG TPA: hypothetical protein VFB38_01755 [Chthonomonadaceae bacterium]|nr:hypothetical protein [Chthonomonadaceae bacterium]
MLRHEETMEQEPPAAQVRVSPQELAQAVATVEARKEAETRRQMDTIPIGEAVQQLGLYVSPEEVLAEIKGQRASAAIAAAATRKRRRRLTLTGALLTLSLAANLLLVTLLLSVNNRPMPAPDMAPATPFTETLPYGQRRLSDVADNEVVYSNLYAIHELNQGKQPSEVLVSTETGNTNQWALVKLNDKLYVRGLATPGTVVMEGTRKFNLLSGPSNTLLMGGGLVPKTVPVEEFKAKLDPDYADQNGVEAVYIPGLTSETGK